MNQLDDGLPLTGVRILDLTHVGAGPFASSLLGQLGADVIKVEGPNGDRMRQNRPLVGAGTVGYYFASVNAQKRFVQIDLRSPAGQQLLHRIVPQVDVIVENFGPGVAARLGLGFDTLHEINPRLIYCSIKGFRLDSRYAELASLDYVHEAMTGVMSITGYPGEVPPLPGYPAADFSGALYGALSVVVALRARDQGGQGQFIEVPLQDSLLSLMPLRLGFSIATGEDFPTLGRYHRDFAPFGVYETVDGPIVIAAGTERLWRKFVTVLPDLDLPEFSDQDGRLRNKDRLNGLVTQRLSARDRATWLTQLWDAGVPAAPVMRTSEVINDPYVVDRMQTLNIGDDTYSWIPYAPIHSVFTPKITRPPTAAGAHTREVLTELGLSPDEVDDLAYAGVVRPAPSSSQ
jgi:crotonobetainyl-CoA:carnitine CoA-transferase CaiB-like acyl-CoA transferase